MRILIVEDEIRLSKNIKKGLETVPSFVCDISNDGEDGEHFALTNEYDLIILDLMLPGRDGLSILQAIRSTGKSTPVLILSAKNTKEDIVTGLDFGSDDYLTKPFDLGELIARCKALLRRSKAHINPVIKIGEMEIDTRKHIIKNGDNELILPALEYRLLEYLAYHQGEIISKNELLEHLYDYNWEKFSNVLEVYVSYLRKKLEKIGISNMIHTIRNQGYLLSPEPPKTLQEED